MKYVDVILPLPFPKPLTYGIPIEWQGMLVNGMRVEVPLGRNKTYSGIAHRIHDDKPETYQVKPIKRILDQQPIVSAAQLELWDWVASYYLCSLGEVMQVALPAYLKLMNESVLTWNTQYHVIPSTLSADAYLVAEALQIRKQITIQEFRDILDNRNISSTLDELLKHDIILVSESLEEKFKPKLEKRIEFSETFRDEAALHILLDSLSRSTKQLAVVYKYLELTKGKTAIPVATLQKAAQATSVQINALVEKGVFVVSEHIVGRLKSSPITQPLALELSDAQTKAIQHIDQQWIKHDVVLLKGVTGSGKTMVYISLIQEAISKGKQVLLLLPEIALTTHIVSRLSNYFGEQLGVYHSRFTDNERVEIWNKVQDRSYKVVIGPRSAIWLPFQSLSHIIVDEEHDASFKQYDPAPRFHARDTAIMYGHITKAKVLLGSATPSIESYHNALQGKYGLVNLSSRYQDIAMPEVKIIHAKNYIPALSNILTKPLLDAIAETIYNSKQVILFQNKRGYAPFILCGACGWVPKCKQCDVSLTYHKHTDKLHCHYCGYTYQRITLCEQCGSNAVTARQFGTERIEEELLRIFKDVKVARLDIDAVKGKKSHANIIENFEQGKVQILVGTQMVVKGLDFTNVDLVGVVSADSLLSFPDFRIHERAFQLLVQVAGRAGRRADKGLVLVQANKTDHPVLHWVQHHDYESFYANEIQARQNFGYPPFTRIIKVNARHLKEEVALKAIQTVTTHLSTLDFIHLKGPSPALVSRVKNQYIFEFWIQVGRSATQLQAVKEAIAYAIAQAKAMRGMSSVHFYADVDPV